MVEYRLSLFLAIGQILKKKLWHPEILTWASMGEGWIRLIVGFQPLMVISPAACFIRWCMQVYAWWSNVDRSWAERSMPGNFWVPNHRFNFATGEQKGITETIYTDSKPPNRLPNSLIPSAKLRSANLPVLRLWCDAVGVEPRTPAPRSLWYTGAVGSRWENLKCGISRERLTVERNGRKFGTRGTTVHICRVFWCPTA